MISVTMAFKLQMNDSVSNVTFKTEYIPTLNSLLQSLVGITHSFIFKAVWKQIFQWTPSWTWQKFAIGFPSSPSNCWQILRAMSSWGAWSLFMAKTFAEVFGANSRYVPSSPSPIPLPHKIYWCGIETQLYIQIIALCISQAARMIPLIEESLLFTKRKKVLW